MKSASLALPTQCSEVHRFQPAVQEDQGVLYEQRVQAEVGAPDAAPQDRDVRVRQDVSNVTDGLVGLFAQVRDVVEPVPLPERLVPVARGGSSTETNVQLLCRRCNGRKSDAI